MKKFYAIAFCVLAMAFSALSQTAVPRESQRQEITQHIGDTKVTIVYHRPNVKGRTVWGELVKYGEVWRAGANENTTIEFSRDVTINGKPLPAGKYGFHTLPTNAEWTLIFNKVNDAWGSFSYDQTKDALRVAVTPQKAADSHESMQFEFNDITANTADVVLAWERLRIPFTVDIGDISGRTMVQLDEAVKNRKADDVRPLNQAASYVLSAKIEGRYNDALGWLNTSLKERKNFNTMATKARLLEQAGRRAEAIAAAEEAIAFGRSATPAASTADLERLLTEWKAKP